jgi:hypothetical protein
MRTSLREVLDIKGSVQHWRRSMGLVSGCAMPHRKKQHGLTSDSMQRRVL